MYAYIKGELVEKNPTYAIVDCSGLGYLVHISLYTYTQIKDLNSAKLFLAPIIREDAHLLFGFFDEDERRMFLLLLAVSGVGANTARMILSAMNPAELSQAILNGEVKKIKTIKGIGEKTAQRIIVDLKDKVQKEDFGLSANSLLSSKSHPAKEEACAALMMLGFPRNAVDKVLQTLSAANPDLNTESLIKQALRML